MCTALCCLWFVGCCLMLLYSVCCSLCVANNAFVLLIVGCVLLFGVLLVVCYLFDVRCLLRLALVV